MSDRYTEMSDAELIEELRGDLPDRSWTLGQMVELERRGFDSIASDVELHAAITTDHDAMQEKFRQAFRPALERAANISGLNERLTELSRHFKLPEFRPITFPDYSLPMATEIEALGVPNLEAQEIAQPDFDRIVDKLANDAERQAAHDEGTLALQVEQLEVLHDLTGEVAKSNRRDRVDWLLIVAAILAAVASVVAAVAALAG